MCSPPFATQKQPSLRSRTCSRTGSCLTCFARGASGTSACRASPSPSTALARPRTTRYAWEVASVIRNVGAVVAARTAEKRDVRVGLSFVVMRENAEELLDLVDLAHDLGVDWIKLEELVPVTPRAARSLLARPSFVPLVAAARARGEASGYA